METGFSSNIRPKRAMNTLGCHHATAYHSFPEIRFQFTFVRPILKKFLIVKKISLVFVVKLAHCKNILKSSFIDNIEITKEYDGAL